MSIAIIPARGGSQRIPHKNVREFHGKPIIAYSIESARASGLFDKIIVSTDDVKIARIADNHGAMIHIRPAALAQDEVGTQEVVKAVLETIGRRAKPNGYACCIYATAPLMTADDLRRGYNIILKRLASFAFSVGTDPLQDAGQWYWGRVSAFLESVPLIDEQTVMVPIDRRRVCDINTEEDWARAEAMFISIRDGV